jgi:hypothetical protein
MQMPKPTVSRLIVARELSTGPKSWGQLIKAYYGEDRNKLKVNTSFWNKKCECLTLGIMRQDPLTHLYSIDEAGKMLIEYAKANNIDLPSLKSEAQIRYEIAHGKV